MLQRVLWRSGSIVVLSRSITSSVLARWPCAGLLMDRSHLGGVRRLRICVVALRLGSLACQRTTLGAIRFVCRCGGCLLLLLLGDLCIRLAKPTFAAGVGVERGLEILAIEVGPERRCGVVFRVGRL